MRPLLLIKPDGTSYHVLPSISLMTAPEGGRKVAILTLKNVSEIHEASLRLESSERKYRELVENANSIIMRITPDHTITYFNEYAQTFFGYGAEEIIGRNVLGTIAPETDSEGHDLRSMFRDITDHPDQHSSNENENMCKNGRRVWVHWANRAVRDPQGTLVEILCVGTDITRRREVEAQSLRYQKRLKELTERLALSEEEDRWRISRYIHDTIIQNLSLSTIRLGSMTKPLAEAHLADQANTLTQVRGMLNLAIDECRMVMSDLTPALLYELGLVPALHDLAQRVQEKYGGQVTVEDDGQEKPLSPPLRGMVFEASRELVMNALKHAGPCTIHVAASRDEGDLVIRVADTGKGFDTGVATTSLDNKGGFGLFNIRQRLEGLGGRLEIESAPGRGTVASLRVPVLSL
jgi:PAS domain S-box-containing protein